MQNAGFLMTELITFRLEGIFVDQQLKSLCDITHCYFDGIVMFQGF